MHKEILIFLIHISGLEVGPDPISFCFAEHNLAFVSQNITCFFRGE